MRKSKRIGIICSGLERRKDRGYANSSYVLFRNLQNEFGAHVQLYKSSGPRKPNEVRLRLPSLIPYKLQHWLGDLRKDRFEVEHVIFALSFFIHCVVLRRKFDVLYTQEPRVGLTLSRLRRFLPCRPKVVFGMGVTMSPKQFLAIGDRVHVANIERYEAAISEFPEKLAKMRCIPNPGAPEKEFKLDIDKRALKLRRNIREDHLLLCVGAINREIKRTDYVIKEFLNLPSSWALVLVGKLQDPTIFDEIPVQIRKRIYHFFVHPEEVPSFFAMSDIAILGSLKEGFPNVLLEATQNGIAPIMHKCRLTEWALEGVHTLVNMTQEGTVSALIVSNSILWWQQQGDACRKIYSDKLSWESNRKAYRELLYLEESN